MRHARRFVSRLLNRPQLIEPGAAAAVLGALLPGAEILAYAGPADPIERDARDYQVTTSATAIIPIVGELVHRGAAMDASSGLTSYQALQDMFADALGDPGVTGVLLDIDSPGGEASGLLDFTEWLAAQRGTKPIWASVNLAACSAAYAIASAADRIVMTGADAVAGSIGCVAVHTDLSGALAKQGAKLTFVYAGAHKIDGNTAMPLPDAVRDECQAEVDALYDRFCRVVATNRGISVAAVRGTEARVFNAADAVAAGLADDIATQEDVLMTLTERRAPAGARLAAAAGSRAGVLMAEPPAPRPIAVPVPVAPVAVPVAPQPKPPAPTQPPPTPPQTDVEPPVPDAAPTERDQADMPADEADNMPRRNTPSSPVPAHPQALANACTTAGFPELIAPLLAEGATMARVERRLADAKGIKDAAAQAGLPGMAPAMIRAGMSLADARNVIFSARAGAADATPIATAHAGGTTGAGASAPPGPITVAEGRAMMSRFNAAARGS